MHEIVISPKYDLISHDWKSALVGLYKMVLGVSIVYSIVIIEKIINDPNFLFTNDWMITLKGLLLAITGTIATYWLNIAKKWADENQYIK